MFKAEANKTKVTELEAQKGLYQPTYNIKWKGLMVCIIELGIYGLKSENPTSGNLFLFTDKAK